MQMRWDCFSDTYPEKASFRKGKKGKVGNVSKARLSVIFCFTATGKSYSI